MKNFVHQFEIFKAGMAEYIKERSAKINRDEGTFFNPAQQLNRDISAETIKSVFKSKENVRIFDAMSATGLRGIRYLNEIPNSQLFFNDISPLAVSVIKSNLEMNGHADVRRIGDGDDIRANARRVNLMQGDCSLIMNKHHGFFDVIDIDPFGSCANFIDDAFRAIKHNGLLCLTCTDKAALCANEKKCYMRYGAQIKRIYSKNETPIRVLLGYISRVLAKYDACITPVLSLSVDFYVRVIVQVRKNRGKSVLEDNSHALICGCLNSKVYRLNAVLNPQCDVCGAAMKLYGPYWNKAVYNKEIVRDILSGVAVDGNERMVGILRLILQEIDAMFYYELPQLCSKLKVDSCKLRELMNALANAGFAVSLVHYDNNAIKTDAPLSVINSAMQQKHAGIDGKFDFSSNAHVDSLFAETYFKGKVMSGLRPLSLPKTS